MKKNSAEASYPRKFMILPKGENLWLHSYDLKPLKDLKFLKDISLSHSLYMFLSNDLPPLLLPSQNDPSNEFLQYDKLSLIRDLEVPNDIGMKKCSGGSSFGEKSILPHLPKLIYEEYPLFKPQGIELSKDEFEVKYTKPFFRKLDERLSKCSLPIDSLNLKFEEFQTAAELPEEFDEYLELFNDKLWSTLLDLFLLIIYNKQTLLQFMEETYEGYIPILTPVSPINLKPIGSCGDVSFTWGIFDNSSRLLNELICHVEILDMRLGIREGCDLYFGKESKEKMLGSDFTKRNNFMKRFHKCVSICLNSHTRRFIMLDYGWCACFEIQDVEDCEIEDVIRLTSKVKVSHFSYTPDVEDSMSMRTVIASFLYTTPEKSLKDSKAISKVNTRISKEWKSFNEYESLVPLKKKLKPSPVKYSHNGLTFTRSYVNLNDSIEGFIAIGSMWSCQTLQVDTSKLFPNLDYKAIGLISVYDEYYQDYGNLMLPRHKSTPISKLEHNSVLNHNAKDLVDRWCSNVQAYLKLEPLQGECIAKLLAYGYLEDMPYNGPDIHYKTDGYYLLYEPITEDNDDLKPLDLNVPAQFQKAKETIQMIHSYGITFNPKINLSYDVLKWCNDQVYVINLEKSSMGSEGDKRRDLNDLKWMLEHKRDLMDQ
jgi:hypothetical protein